MGWQEELVINETTKLKGNYGSVPCERFSPRLITKSELWIVRDLRRGIQEIDPRFRGERFRTN